MKIKILGLLLVSFSLVSPCKAEYSEEAKENARFAKIYAQTNEADRIAFAKGITWGQYSFWYRLPYDNIARNWEIAEEDAVLLLLNFCYKEGRCKHINPGKIAGLATSKIQDAKKILLIWEEKEAAK